MPIDISVIRRPLWGQPQTPARLHTHALAPGAASQDATVAVHSWPTRAFTQLPKNGHQCCMSKAATDAAALTN
eukprot:3729089-Alexandrium_andersonii.AAC.1